MIDNALSFGEAYADDRAPTEFTMTHADNDASDTVKLATALHFIADNLDDINTESASEKLAEAELLMAYLRDAQEAQDAQAIKLAHHEAARAYSGSARNRLASILSK